MGTTVDRIDPTAGCFDQGDQAPVCLVELGNRQIPARDARLIGHHDHEPAGPIELPDRLTGALDQPDLLVTADVTDFDINRTVSIEKNCLTTTHSDYSLLGPLPATHRLPTG